ncbi:MAG: polyprenyl synthetase family protein, partial [Phycisphaerales bacterium]
MSGISGTQMAERKGVTDEAMIASVEPVLASFVRSVGLPRNLREAVEYALLEGGKRLRPLLSMHSAIAVGGTADDALPAAAAVEMIHAFSLVHDDLPALD